MSDEEKEEKNLTFSEMHLYQTQIKEFIIIIIIIISIIITIIIIIIIIILIIIIIIIIIVFLIFKNKIYLKSTKDKH